ncbi:MAG: hypothetical protein R2692_03985 [Microbacterium sp.]
MRAARYMREPTHTILTRHIIPNMASLLIIDATLGVVSAIMAETSLSYFGFGIQKPDVSLGTPFRRDGGRGDASVAVSSSPLSSSSSSCCS